VTLLDLGTMLGLSSAPTTADQYAALLLGLPGLKAGLVVDEIVGVERLKLASLLPSLSGREFARGVSGQTVMLDLEQLLMSGRFDVLDDVILRSVTPTRLTAPWREQRRPRRAVRADSPSAD
jgi:chemotaxis signal transduction protein